ncbi:hypothetical protein ONA23_00630 [Mycoplasmopsis cynos]|nr:hypothetical protein [Mycoplasmopsis cynos]WAM06765.1 hypothetical protein ONA23_00630 [Mycoplasmopsis cynos]
MNENNIYSTVIFFSKPDVTYFNKVINECAQRVDNIILKNTKYCIIK